MFIFRTRSRNMLCAAPLSIGTSFTVPENCFSPRNRSRTSAAPSDTCALQITYRSAARATAHPAVSNAATRSFVVLVNISRLRWRSEADRILQERFVVAAVGPVRETGDRVGEMGLGELQLEAGHEIDVEAHAERVA